MFKPINGTSILSFVPYVDDDAQSANGIEQLEMLMDAIGGHGVNVYHARTGERYLVPGFSWDDAVDIAGALIMKDGADVVRDDDNSTYGMIGYYHDRRDVVLLTID